jgi:uncharacterized protein YgiM (DUF1202 family)
VNQEVIFNMKNSQWQRATLLTSALLLTATVFTAPSFAVNVNQTQAAQSSASTNTKIQNSGEYLLAQVSENCRQVIARNGLNVRREPTVNSEAIGIIGSGRNVTIQSLGTNGWIPITAPLQGYVYGGFLGACGVATAPPPSDCRRVVADTGLNVHQAPSTDGATVGVVNRGRRVTIENLGANGWVPITVPLRGYVQAENLAYCR